MTRSDKCKKVLNIMRSLSGRDRTGLRLIYRSVCACVARVRSCPVRSIETLYRWTQTGRTRRKKRTVNTELLGGSSGNSWAGERRKRREPFYLDCEQIRSISQTVITRNTAVDTSRSCSRLTVGKEKWGVYFKLANSTETYSSILLSCADWYSI